MTAYFASPHIENGATVRPGAGDTAGASAWRSTCLMHCLDIKRSWLGMEGGESLFEERGETNRASVEEKRGGVAARWIRTRCSFHLILSRNVRMDLQKWHKGAAGIWAIWPRIALKACEGGTLTTYIYSLWYLLHVHCRIYRGEEFSLKRRLPVLAWIRNTNLTSNVLSNDFWPLTQIS